MGYMKRHVGERIKLFRKKRNMSQAQLAKRVGVTQPMISAMEHGEKGWAPETLFRLAQV